MSPLFPVSRRARGFTLIELLIVIAVIGILAALLFPTFARARRIAYRTTCLSNLKQIGLAVEMYQNDNNRYYPAAINPVTITCAWPDRLTSYIKSPATFQCPMYPEGEFMPGCPADDVNNDTDSGVPIVTSYNGGYDLNTMGISGFGFRMTRVDNPSRTIFALDGRGEFVNPGTDPITGVNDLITRSVKLCHDNGTNILFCDGHVKWLRGEQMLDRSIWRADGAK